MREGGAERQRPAAAYGAGPTWTARVPTPPLPPSASTARRGPAAGASPRIAAPRMTAPEGVRYRVEGWGWRGERQLTLFLRERPPATHKAEKAERAAKGIAAASARGMGSGLAHRFAELTTQYSVWVPPIWSRSGWSGGLSLSTPQHANARADLADAVERLSPKNLLANGQLCRLSRLLDDAAEVTAKDYG
jgi:hypothetical protein